MNVSNNLKNYKIIITVIEYKERKEEKLQTPIL